MFLVAAIYQVKRYNKESSTYKKKDNYKNVISFSLNLYDSMEEDAISKEFDVWFSTIESYFDKANESIMIFDYVDHGKSIAFKEGDDSKAKIILKKRYDKYFEKLEQVIFSKNIVYKRILMLPYIPKQMQDDGELYHTTNALSLETACKMLYEPTKDHIKRVIEKCNQLDQENKFVLYLLSPPLRNFSEVIIDKCYWINEIDFINAEGYSCPDTLFFNERNLSEDGVEIKKEMDLFENMKSSRCKIINYSEFLNIYYEANPHSNDKNESK